ncbi:MAG: hypothetical protein AB8B74_08560 [Crocinitomicaceae bacterium]
MTNHRPLLNFILFVLILGEIFLMFYVFNTFNSEMRDYMKVLEGLKTISFMVVPVLCIGFAALAAMGLDKKHSYGQRFRRASLVIGLILYTLLAVVIIIKSA